MRSAIKTSAKKEIKPKTKFIGSKELYKTLAVILKKYLKKKKKFSFKRYGVVLNVQDGIVLASGLEKVGLTEVVSFRNGIKGMVSTLERDCARICLMGPETQIKPGDIISRTKRYITVPVGFNLLGRVVDSLGKPIDGKGALTHSRPSTVYTFKNLRTSLLVYARRKDLRTITFEILKPKIIKKFKIIKKKNKKL